MKTLLSILFSIFIQLGCFAAEIDTLFVYSQAMKKEVPNIIIKPSSSQESLNKRYPTVYLLHGADGNYTNWPSKVDTLLDLVDRYQIIVVCPDGGETSWYFDSPIDPAYQYETYMSKELVPAIDQRYPTIKKKNKRAIAGLSMGGHGAIYLAANHPTLWGAVGSMSGGVDFRPFPKSWDIAKRLGSYAKNKQRWNEHAVINCIDKIGAGDFYLSVDCGRDDFFFEVNQTFHEKLVEQNIPHSFTIEAGVHDWGYWAKMLPAHMRCFNEFFRQSE